MFSLNLNFDNFFFQLPYEEKKNILLSTISFYVASLVYNFGLKNLYGNPLCGVFIWSISFIVPCCLHHSINNSFNHIFFISFVCLFSICCCCLILIYNLTHSMLNALCHQNSTTFTIINLNLIIKSYAY